MRDQGTPAHIVNTASIAGLLSGVAFIGPYCGDQGRGRVDLRDARQELAIDGLPIGVSVLCPSSVDTRVMESERGAPAGARDRAPHRVGRVGAARDPRLVHRPDRADPAQVAERALDAIRAGEFWIITHPGERSVVEARVTTALAHFPPALGSWRGADKNGVEVERPRWLPRQARPHPLWSCAHAERPTPTEALTDLGQ